MWKRMAVGANSNTTLVKVKYKPARRINLQEKDSNTTLVKVKCFVENQEELQLLNSNTTLVKVKLMPVSILDQEAIEFKYNTC